MINWIEATPENIEKYFHCRTPWLPIYDSKVSLVFLTENKDIITNKNDCFVSKDVKQSILFDGYKKIGKVTHFALRCDFDKILPKGDL